MEFKVIVIFVVGFLGLLSFCTGFVAEFTRIKASEIEELSSTYCIYPGSYAKFLGLIAATSLLVAQIILNTLFGCVFCKNNYRNTIRLRFLCLLSWVTCLIGVHVFLAEGALKKNRLYYGCYYVKPGVFCVGALLSFLSLMFGLFYHITVTKDDLSNDSLHQIFIPMPQP